MNIAQLTQHTLDNIGKLVLGKESQIRLALCCLFARGHLLIEDLPGMGKTTLSHALAQVMGLSYRRVQFTSDLLPADIVGVSIFKPETQLFEFHQGPIFSQILLADEINRASPKTQSALLEAMEERQVTVDGKTSKLPEPFFVIATQNPLHQSGTFPLPESQLDRFLVRITLGYPEQEAEMAMLMNNKPVALESLPVCISPEQLLAIQQQVHQVTVTESLVEYLLKLVKESRENSEFAMGLSPRASKALLLTAKAWALMAGRDYVTADDLQAILPAVAEHRLNQQSMAMESGLSQRLLSLVEPL
ncbi:AAA family ATPase [Saccharobesus litoralis]|uniref:AAA family ATPase n=1 Tax=Saccharobesus litoralis TaxID=2172099 RepID=A0A2S0VSM4_9ALTE|nr:MoxR family ATPase [Saccharobesus litoralis]AWB67215.1 AAA family ATPase [Saccharobesus litoralis]